MDVMVPCIEMCMLVLYIWEKGIVYLIGWKILKKTNQRGEEVGRHGI